MRTLNRLSYIKTLEDRIAYLEIQLSSHGIQDADHSPAQASPTVNAASVTSSAYPDYGSEADLAAKIARGSLGAGMFAGSSIDRSGLSLLSSLLADPMSRALRSNGVSDSHNLLGELPYETRASMPSKEASLRLIDTYFEHCDFFSPIMSSREDFFRSIQPLFDSSLPQEGSSLAKFRALVVFGTAVLLLNRSDPTVPLSKSEAYFAAALRVFSQQPEVICTGDSEHLINLLLIIQHCCFCANLTAAWHFIGLATRLALELDFHRGSIVGDGQDEGLIDSHRWLFWSIYVFERNLCVIIGRPSSIPDAAIQTPLPIAPENDPRRAVALHLIKCRLLESEMHDTLSITKHPPAVTLDKVAWKRDMYQRLLAWHASVPPASQTSQLAPADIFDGYFFNSMVLLHYPSPLFPTTPEEELRDLAEYAITSIDCYREAFKAGRLRFYWRTVHNLFRSGMAVAYCAHLAASRQHVDYGFGSLTTPMNSCSSILWGMVERYPAGKAYRDIFDSVVASVKNHGPTTGMFLGDPAPMEQDMPMSIFDQIAADFGDGSLPLPAMDTISWGFSGSHDT